MDCLKKRQSNHICHHPHRFNGLATKVKSGVGNPDWHVSLFDIHLRKLLWVSCLTERKSPVRLAGKAALTNGLRPGRSEVLRSLRHFLQGTKPRTSHHRSSGGERRGKRKRSTIFLERTREGHRQPDEHWNRFKGIIWETSERRGGAHVGFSEPLRYHLESLEVLVRKCI